MLGCLSDVWLVLDEVCKCIDFGLYKQIELTVFLDWEGRRCELCEGWNFCGVFAGQGNVTCKMCKEGRRNVSCGINGR